MSFRWIPDNRNPYRKTRRKLPHICIYMFMNSQKATQQKHKTKKPKNQLNKPKPILSSFLFDSFSWFLVSFSYVFPCKLQQEATGGWPQWRKLWGGVKSGNSEGREISVERERERERRALTVQLALEPFQTRWDKLPLGGRVSRGRPSPPVSSGRRMPYIKYHETRSKARHTDSRAGRGS